MAASENRSMADFPLFDWLRIAMAVTVVAAHSGLIPWASAGNLAVQVFFALSGWLIGTILIEMKSNKLPLFYFNRTTRVWIPYFLALTFLYLVSIVKEPMSNRWLEFLTYDVTFTHNLFTLTPTFKQAVQAMPLRGTGNHFWSIAVEEQFYLVAPLILLFVPGGRHPILWAVMGVAMVFVRQEFSAIALGVAAAAMQARHPGFHTRPGPRLAIALILIGSAFGLSSANVYPKVASLFAVSLVLLIALPGKRGPIGRFLGGISYPLYLNHWIALVLVSSLAKRLGGNLTVWAAGAMVLTLAIGAGAYWLIDRQVLIRRKQWYTPSLGWKLAALSYVLVGVGLLIGVNLHGNTFVQKG